MELGIVAAVVLVVGVPMVTWMESRWRARRARRIPANQAWAAVADELGGSLTLPSYSWGSPASRKISVLLGGLTVIADHYRVKINHSYVTHTRVRVGSTGPRDLNLEVYQAGIFSDLARAVGFQDVPLGVPEFDESFMVKSNAPELARLWLHAEIRRSIESVPNYRFTIDSGEVKLERIGLEHDPDRLVAALRAAASFADGRQRLREIYQQLARQFGGGPVSTVPDGWLKLELESAGVALALATEFKHGEGCTVVRGGRLGNAPEEYRLGTDEALLEGRASVAIAGLPPDFFVFTEKPELLGRRLSPDIITLLDRLVPEELSAAGEEIVLRWGGVETDPNKLKAAIELTVKLCQAASQGPYR